MKKTTWWLEVEDAMGMTIEQFYEECPKYAQWLYGSLLQISPLK